MNGQSTRACPYCAENLPEGATYCRACNSDIQKGLQKKIWKSRIAGWMVIFGVILFIVAGLNIDKLDPAVLFDGLEPTACDIHEWVGRAVIESYAKYPESSRLPSCLESQLEHRSLNMYRMSGYIIVPNAFGVESRVSYSVLLEYDGSDPSDAESWDVISEPTISE